MEQILSELYGDDDDDKRNIKRKALCYIKNYLLLVMWRHIVIMAIARGDENYLILTLFYLYIHTYTHINALELKLYLPHVHFM